MTLDQIVREVQRELRVVQDGKPGPQTWAAIHERIVPRVVPTVVDGGRVDDRSERIILTLVPEVRGYARTLVQRAAAIGIEIKVISGTRTYEAQDALYAQGRTAPGSIVTKARGGYSNHNFGIAFDIGVFEGPSYIGESPKYAAAAAIGKDLGLEWGGDWKSIEDQPHFQLRPAWALGMKEAAMLAELRRLVAGGKPLF